MSIQIYTPDGKPPTTQFWIVQGSEFTGKDHFAYSFPGPIGVLAFDAGYARPMNRYPGKEFHVENIKAPAPQIVKSGAKPNIHNKKVELVQAAVDMQAYVDCWDESVAAWRTFIADPKIRTVVVDTGKNWWDLFRGARQGSLSRVTGNRSDTYHRLNLEFGALIAMGTEKNGCDKHVLWLEKMEDEWETTFVEVTDRDGKTSKKEVRATTGRVVVQRSFNNLVYEADIIVEMKREGATFGLQFQQKTGTNPELVNRKFWNDEETRGEYKEVLDMYREEYENPEIGLLSYEVMASELELTVEGGK